MASDAEGAGKTVHLIAASLPGAPPVVGAPTLTVGEIAERLGTFPSDPEGIPERVRHWTREGFLVPVASHHAGTGRPRQYDAETHIDVALLATLADAGLNISTHGYLREALVLARRAREKWTKSKRGGNLFLEISRPKVGAPILAIHEGTIAPNPNARLSIFVDLAQIFSEVDQQQSGAHQLK